MRDLNLKAENELGKAFAHCIRGLRVTRNGMSPGDRRQILERHDYVCAYCNAPATEVDHIIPWGHMQDDSDDNLIASCKLCNCIAGGRVFSSFTDKKYYIQRRLRSVQKRNPLCLWTAGEVREIGAHLMGRIGKNILVCRDDDDQEAIVEELTARGYRVLYKNKQRITHKAPEYQTLTPRTRSQIKENVRRVLANDN